MTPTLPQSDHSEQDEQTVDGGQRQFRWPTDEASRIRRVEAVLMMARQPLNTRKISQLADLEDGTQARTMIKLINQRYDQQQRAFQVKKVAGGYQMRTRPQFARWIRQLDFAPAAQRLSTPALETLTVVAYRQPIIKADIEAIRGVSCGEMLRQLLEKGLIKIAGRSESLGRPFLYATSKDFLTQYGLNTLKDLPRFDQLSGKGLPDWVSGDENHRPEGKQDSIDSVDINGDSTETPISNTVNQPQPPRNLTMDPSTDGPTAEEEE